MTHSYLILHLLMKRQLNLKQLFRMAYYLVLLFICNDNQAQTDEPLAVGNFSLPGSQIPATLLGFGQFNIDKNQQQFFVLPLYAKGQNTSSTALELQYVKGLTDRLSFMLVLPYAAHFKENNQTSSGFIDSNIQFEYVAISKTDQNHQVELSLVGVGSIPSGSATKNPPTGLGSPSIFGGTTLSYIGNMWYAFSDIGYRHVLPDKNQRAGHSLFYDAGIGRHIVNIRDVGYLFFLLEVNGERASQDLRLDGVDPDSGGHTLFLSPSLTFATKRFSAQLGTGIPIYQKLNGNQNQNQFFTLLILGWTFDD